MDLEQVTLENLGGGTIGERFSFELRRVIKNIQDINTISNETREITIKISLKPTPERELAATEIKVSSKLAPLKPHSCALYMDKGGNAYENNPNQMQMNFKSENKPQAINE